MATFIAKYDYPDHKTEDLIEALCYQSWTPTIRNPEYKPGEAVPKESLIPNPITKADYAQKLVDGMLERILKDKFMRYKTATDTSNQL